MFADNVDLRLRLGMAFARQDRPTESQTKFEAALKPASSHRFHSNRDFNTTPVPLKSNPRPMLILNEGATSQLPPA